MAMAAEQSSFLRASRFEEAFPPPLESPPQGRAGHPLWLAAVAGFVFSFGVAVAGGWLTFETTPLAGARLSAGVTLGLLCICRCGRPGRTVLLAAGGMGAAAELLVVESVAWPAAVVTATSNVATAGLTFVTGRAIIRFRRGLLFTPRNAAMVSLAAAVIGTPLTAYASSLVTTALADGVGVWSRTHVWWVANLIGVAYIAPFVVALDPRLELATKASRRRDWGVALIVAAMLAGVTGLVFGDVIAMTAVASCPFLLWATIAFGFRGAAVSLAVFGVMVLAFTSHGLGPFFRLGDDTPQTFIMVAWFLAIVANLFLVLAASLERELRTAADLRTSNAQLEGRVADRTRELEQSRDALRDRDRRKDEFLATLGHELRNPLAGVVGAADLLARDADAGPGDAGRLGEFERRECLDVVVRQSVLMKRLVDDLLEMGRVNTGKLRLQIKPVDLRELVNDTVDAAEPLAASQGVRLHVHLPDEEWPVEGDADRLSQVLHNLLTNAVKFSAGGDRVTVSGRIRRGRVQVTVEDEGVGMDQDLIGKLFTPFSQAETTLDRSHGGLGLGLALARRLVELHGGTIVGESEGPGRGSRFTVRLPLSRRFREPVKTSDSGLTPVRPLDILIIDDSRAAAFPVIKLSEMAGHAVRSAVDGFQGLEIAAQWTPDLICCDIGLPGMDGYEVARRVRADPRLRTVRMVAITGYGTDEDRRAALDAGFDDHIAKPVSSQALRRVWNEVSHAGGVAEPAMS